MNARQINQTFAYLVTMLIGVMVIMAAYNTLTWKDSIKNPDNAPYVVEVAFNEGCAVHDVTQRMFNNRYK